MIYPASFLWFRYCPFFPRLINRFMYVDLVGSPADQAIQIFIIEE